MITSRLTSTRKSRASGKFVVFSNRARRPSKADLKELVQLTEAHREELLVQWEAAVDVKTPGPER